MARKPFNPDDAIGGLFDQAPETEKPAPVMDSSSREIPNQVEAPARVDKKPPLTPSSLNQRVKDVLERGIPGPLEVVGELSNLKRQGHWYFSLKDDDSVVSCVMWRSDAGRVDFDPRNGDEVVIKGRISHWQPAGRTQFYASSIRKKGLGNLEERFQALCAELRREGYFDDDRKMPLPAFPRRIAVVTSATGAAIEDVRRTAATRLPAVQLLVIDVRVQGDDAPGQIAAAITKLDRNAEALGIDAILVTRGGGSREDLWAFNERIVADAAFACRTPLIAAIGHEVDTSVIELIADRRASTPTQAAMFLIPDRTELLGQVQYLEERLRTVV
ncbi:MAG TPA: exodeoxyribonuclease VII large subunit, partial [Phycisphaerales bacterium]|nr:exodeoxyribonuclease VII large subunit [Phycisphaerales bacterium]